jgi:hypothetical protein
MGTNKGISAFVKHASGDDASSNIVMIPDEVKVKDNKHT